MPSSGQEAIQVLFLMCDFLTVFGILRPASVRKRIHIRRATVKPEEISKAPLLEDLLLNFPWTNCRFLLPILSPTGLGKLLQFP